MEMRFKGAKALFASLQAQLESTVQANLKKQSENLKDDLVKATPIDTGFARGEWKLLNKGASVEISNDAPYIQYLNNGTSRQAPANFIEKTALTYGTPLGSITESK